MTDNSDTYWNEAFALLCDVEGVKLRPYKDQGGVWTIGIGSTRINGVPVTKDTGPITMEQAEAQCRLDMQEFDQALTRYVHAPLTIGQRTALLSFTYNLGEGNLKASTLLRLLNDGNYGERLYNGACSGAVGQFPLWNKVRINGVLVPSAGLTKRRALEQAVFLGEYAPSTSVSNLQLTASPVKHAAPAKPTCIPDMDAIERAETDRLNEEQLNKYN